MKSHFCAIITFPTQIGVGKCVCSMCVGRVVFATVVGWNTICIHYGGGALFAYAMVVEH